MGFFDNLGDAIAAAGGIAKDVLWDESVSQVPGLVGGVAKSVVQPPLAVSGIVIDLATMAWNDDEDYNGFLHTLERRGMARLGQFLAPLDALASGHGEDVLHEIAGPARHVYSYGISRPLTTLIHASGVPGAEGGAKPGAFANPQNWRDAWNSSRDISPGRAAANATIGTALRTGEAATPFSATQIGGAVPIVGGWVGAMGGLSPTSSVAQIPKSDITTPEGRAAYRHGIGRLASGTGDAVLLWYTDPFVLAGRGIGAGHRAAVTQPIRPSEKARERIEVAESRVRAGDKATAKIMGTTPKPVGPVRVGGDVEAAIRSNRVTSVKSAILALPPESRAEWIARNPALVGPRATDDGSAVMHVLTNATERDIDQILRVMMDPTRANREALELANKAKAQELEHLLDIRVPAFERAAGEAANPAAYGAREWDRFLTGADRPLIDGARTRFAASDVDGAMLNFARTAQDANAATRASYLNRELPAMQEAARIAALDAEMAARSAGTLRNVPRIKAFRTPESGVRWAAYQPSRYNAPMRVLKSASTLRAGVLDLNRPADGYTQLARMMDRAGHGLTGAESLSRAGVDPAAKSAILREWAAATSQGEAAMSRVIEKAEDLTIRHSAERLGYSEATAKELIAVAQSRRNDARSMLFGSRSKAFTGARDPSSGHTIDMLEDGTLVALMETQLVNQVPLLDVDRITKILQRYKNTEKADEMELLVGLRNLRGASPNAPRPAGVGPSAHPFARRGGKAHEFFSESTAMALTRFNQVWKPLQLMRLGWTIRVITDEQLRIISSVGAMEHLASLSESVSRPSQLRVHQFAGMRAERDEILSKAKGPKGARAEDLTRKRAALASAQREATRDPVKITALTDDLLEAEQRALTADGLAGLTNAERMRLKELNSDLSKRRAEKTAKFTDDITLRDPAGNPIKVAGSLADPVFADLVATSAGRQFAELADAAGRELNAARLRMGQSQTILPLYTGADDAGRAAHDKAYKLGWETGVNEQIARSAIGRRILEGRGDEEIVAWLRKSPEGKALRKRMPIRAHDPQRWVEEVRQHVDNMLPPEHPALRALALESRAKIGHLESAVADVRLRPEIHGESVNLALGEGWFWEHWNGLVQGMYRRLGTTPTNVMSRHPHFNSLYMQHMRAQVENWGPRDAVYRAPTRRSEPADDLTPIPTKELERMQRVARERALHGVRTTLYDLSNASNLAHTWRYVTPFYGAWQDALRTWGRLFMEDPSRLAHMVQLWEAPSKMDMVRKDETTGRSYVVFKAPEWLQSVLPEPLEQMEIPKYWMRDLVAQGTYWFAPGVGAPVAVPVAALAREHPDLADNLKPLIPFGAGTSWTDQVSPAAYKRLKSYMLKENDASYASWQAKFMNEEITDNELGVSQGQPARTPEQMYKAARRKADQLFVGRFFMNLTLPFSPSPKAKYETDAPVDWKGRQAPMGGYVAAWRKIEDEYAKFPGRKDDNGKDATERFVETYGKEYFAFTQSLSRSTTGVPPTVKGWQRGQEIADIIAENPALGGFYAGEVDDEFSSTVYNSQFEQKAGPGSPMTQRERRSPEQVLEANQVSQGWDEYLRFSKLIRAEMGKRTKADGTPYLTLTGDGVRDLAVLKKAVVAKLAEKYPAWARARNEITLDKTQETITSLKAHVGDERQDDVPGWKSLRRYMEGREVITKLLEDRYAGGGSSTLGSGENADVAAVWAAFVAKLTDADVAFETRFDRYLQRDLGLTPDDWEATLA